MEKLETTKTLTEIVEAGMARTDFGAMTMEEQTISVAIGELSGWLRQYSPMLRNGGSVGIKIGVSEELARAISANLRGEDADEVLPNLARL